MTTMIPTGAETAEDSHRGYKLNEQRERGSVGCALTFATQLMRLVIVSLKPLWLQISENQ